MPRAGGIHAIPVDLNSDGKMDFVACSLSITKQWSRIIE